MKTLYIIFTFLPLLWTTLVYPQAGSLDHDFGGDGWITTSFVNDQRAEGWAVAFQEDEKILVSGYTLTGIMLNEEIQEAAVIARYLPDGNLDNSFNGNGKIILNIPGASAYSRAIVVQPDGKILVSMITYELDIDRLVLCRFLPDGSPDISFDGDGMLIKSFNTKSLSSNALTLQPDGKIVAGGYVRFDNDDFNQLYVVRFMPDGMPDETFDIDGTVITQVGEGSANIFSILVQPDNKIIAAGYAVYDGTTDYVAVRYNANGTVDHSFGEDGVAFAPLSHDDDRAYGAVLQADGKIVMCGQSFSTVTNEPAFGVARFNTDGTLDNTFHGDGMNIISVSGHADGGRGIILQPDGKIVLGGFAHSDVIATHASMALVRLNENGIPDNTFNGDGIAVYEDTLTSSSLNEIALQPDGKIVGTGYVHNGVINNFSVARFTTGLTTSTSEQYMPVVDISLYPNPISDHFTIDYELDRDETIFVNLYDLQGKMIQNLMPFANRSAGKHIETLNIPGSLPSGNYFLTLESEDWMKSMKVILE